MSYISVIINIILCQTLLPAALANQVTERPLHRRAVNSSDARHDVKKWLLPAMTSKFTVNSANVFTAFG